MKWGNELNNWYSAWRKVFKIIFKKGLYDDTIDCIWHALWMLNNKDCTAHTKARIGTTACKTFPKSAVAIQAKEVPNLKG